MDGRCTGIAAHERLLGTLEEGLRHLGKAEEENSERLERVEGRLNYMGWLLAVTCGGVALQLFLLLVEMKK